MSDPIFVPAGIRPSDEQHAIQTTRARHLLIEANAGAAKTTSLALRIAQALHRGASPQMILALTYTTPAVQALQAQLRMIGVAPAQIAELRIHTFESFSAELLLAIEGPGTLQLGSLEQIKPYMLRAIERAQSWPDERYPEELALAAPSEALVEGLLRSFSVLKGSLRVEQQAWDGPMSPEQAEELDCDYFTLRVRGAFEAIRRGGHPDHPAFRFDGDACYDLARALSGEDGLPTVGEQSPLALELALVVVDEMHDTNRAMFTVLKALLQHNRRAAFVGVGDRHQVIHSQAGAEAGFMREHFDQEIGLPVRLLLTASHRFGGTLALAAGALTGKAYAAARVQPTEVRLLPAESHRLQAQLIARIAQDHLAQSELQDLRLLLRRPSQSILIERELLKLGVGYSIEDFRPFLQRREVLLVRGLQAFCTNDFSGFSSKAQRAEVLEALMLFSGAWIDSTELRHVDAVTAQRRAIEEAAAPADGMHDFIANQVLRTASSFAKPKLEAAMALLRAGSLRAFSQGFLQALDPAGLARAVLVRKEDIEQVRENVAQLVQVVLAEDTSVADGFQMLHALSQVQVRLRAHQRVSLSSIEAAKGLEFDHVLVPHLSRGEFVGEAGAIESRNLLYVAMTRARQRLTLAFNQDAPSQFLRDAGLLAAKLPS